MMSKMQNGVVVVLDALGTKGVWKTNDPMQVIKKWNRVLDGFTNFKEFYNEDKSSVGKAKIISFSDTIIITYVGGKEDQMELLAAMGLNLILPFCTALLEGVFLRGVVSKGQFKQTSKMIIGPAIDEAMNWFERYDWMGITLAPSASFMMDAYFDGKKPAPFFTKYNAPLKHDFQSKNNMDENIWVLDWPNELKEVQFIHENDLDPKGELLEIFSESSIDPTVISKYTNTIDFYDFIINKQKNKRNKKKNTL